MSKSKEKKELANKAIADLRKHLGRDVVGRQLLEHVEEYVKELRRQVSSDKIDKEGMARTIDSQCSAIVRANEDVLELVDRFQKMQQTNKEFDTKINVLNAWLKRFGTATEREFRFIMGKIFGESPFPMLTFVKFGNEIEVCLACDEGESRSFATACLASLLERHTPDGFVLNTTALKNITSKQAVGLCDLLKEVYPELSEEKPA